LASRRNSWRAVEIAGAPSKQKRTVNRHHDTLMDFKSVPFCFSSPLFNNQPIMSPRDSICKEKMAKKALTVHKQAHIYSSFRAAKSLFLLIGLLLFFHFSIIESSYQP
jgi:hypothetical protein